MEAESNEQYSQAASHFDQAAKLFEEQNHEIYATACRHASARLSRLLRARAETEQRGGSRSRRDTATKREARAAAAATTRATSEGPKSLQHLPQSSHVISEPRYGSIPHHLHPDSFVSPPYLKESMKAAAEDLLVLEEDLRVISLSGIARHRPVAMNQSCAKCSALEKEVHRLRQSLGVQRKMESFVKDYELKFQRFRESVATYKEESLRRRVKELQELVGALVRRLEKVENKEC